MNRDEDSKYLSPLQWLKKGLRLSFREICLRIWRLVISLPRNVFAVRSIAAGNRYKNLKPHFVILTGRIGDIVAAGPTIKQLKQNGEMLIWLIRPQYAGLVRHNPFVDRIVCVSSDTEALLLKKIFKNSKWSNLILDGHLCNVFGTLIKNPVSSGINKENFYHFGSLADVISFIGVGHKARERPELYPDSNFDSQEYLRSIFPEPRKLLIFHPDSDEFARSWSIDSARKLADRLLQNTDYNILEVGLKPFLIENDRVRCLRGKLPLDSQIKLFLCAQLYVGVDSGFAHVANAVGARSILLIGKYGNFDNHLPWRLNSEDLVIRSGGQTHEISEDEVFDSVRKMVF